MSNNPPSTHPTTRNPAMKQHVLALAVLAAFGLVSTAQAEVQSGISNPNAAIRVGEAELGTPSHPFEPGDPGIGHEKLANGARISFSSLQTLGDTTGTGAAGDWKVTHIAPPELPPGVPPHTGIGYFNFAQVASEAVFFGEWSQNEASSSDTTHTVYYAGQAGDVAATLPGGEVTYNVKSLNNAYTASADLPNSILTANFGTWSASSTGDITFDEGVILVDADNRVALFADGVSVTSVSGTDGDLVGDFFGTGASSVAGIITFAGETAKDTAFGGAKN